MKILIYGLHFKPDLIGIGKYTGEMADWLHQEGHDIRVITAPHFYPEWQLKNRQWYIIKDKTNYTVWRCPVYVPNKPKGLTRLLHSMSFAISSIPILFSNLTWKPEYVISIEPPFLISPTALLYSKLTRSKSILHIQDLEIDAAYSLNILKRGILYKLIKKFEKFILNRFDVISTISPGMKNEINKKGINDKKMYILPNWADVEKIYPEIDNKGLKEKLNLINKKNIILYSGNMGKKQNLDIIIDVAEMFNSINQDMTFLMVGDGATKDRLEKEVLKRNISNIIFFPLQPIEDLGALLTIADIHLITQDKNLSDYVLPSKLTNILSAGGVSLIAANKETQLSKLVNEYEIGYLVSPDSKEELYKAINDLLNNSSLRRTISKNARRYAVNYLSKDKIMSNFTEQIALK